MVIGVTGYLAGASATNSTDLKYLRSSPERPGGAISIGSMEASQLRGHFSLRDSIRNVDGNSIGLPKAEPAQPRALISGHTAMPRTDSSPNRQKGDASERCLYCWAGTE